MLNRQRIKFIKKIGLMLGAVGPGLFMIGYNIGTGSVTTMASAGSRYGMSMFWALVLSCVFTYVMLLAYGKFTVVSGHTAMAAYKNYLPFGKLLAIYTILVLTIGELASMAGIVGIVSELISEWILILFGGRGVSMIIISSVIIMSCYYLLWIGRYSLFEKFLTLLVMIMGLSFILSMFMVVPEPKELISGLIPRIPDDTNAFLIIASIVGTTCSAMVFIMRSITLAEKGWTVDNLRQGKIDALVSVSMMLLLSGAIMACAAGTLYKIGIPVDRAVDMVKTLEPIAGRFAISVFLIGIIGAGVSTLFPIALVLPWLICDYRGTKRDIHSPMFRILGGLGLMIGLTVPIFGGRPVWVMITSQAFQSTIMPVVTLAIIILINNKKLMGEYRAGLWLNIGLFATLIFAFVTAYIGIIGLIETFSRSFG